jgi:uncharacterized protein YodC (DUF2158 family)
MRRRRRARLPLARRALLVPAIAAAVSACAACAPAPHGAPGEGGPTGPVGATVSAPVALTQALTTAPATGPVADGAADLSTPVTCPSPTVVALDSTALKAALKAARPGDVIGLEHGVYTGSFEITRSGTAAQPIYLCGPSDAALYLRGVQHDTVLHLRSASHWRLVGFTVHGGQKGVMVDTGEHVVLQGLHVGETGHEAVHLRKNSTDNVVRGLKIRKTGLLEPTFGEGIYIGSARSNWCEVTSCAPDRSDRNLVLGNKISFTTAEAVDLKEGTSSGILSDNSFDGAGMVASAADSWVDVKGNGWTISDNRGLHSPKDGFQQHEILPGWGDRNVFRRNTSRLTTPGGVGVRLEKPLRNVVHCDNRTSGGAVSSPATCLP